MEETFGLTWEDSTTVVQTEEVICGIENEILPSQSEEFTGVPEGRFLFVNDFLKCFCYTRFEVVAIIKFLILFFYLKTKIYYF